MTVLELEQGFTLRPARTDDLELVTQLVYDVCVSRGDASIAVTKDEMREAWEDVDFNLETDTWVVTTVDGRVVGYEEFHNWSGHAALLGRGYVHPDYSSAGIGEVLLRARDKRGEDEIARAAPDERVYIRTSISVSDAEAREMHKAAGYVPNRYYWRMEIELEEMPPEPKWPRGIELRPLDADAHGQQLYAAHIGAFADQWGFTRLSFEEWKKHFIESNKYKPESWLIAWDGDEIAGYAVSNYRMGNGWVAYVGVRRRWRRRGLGLALLQQAFGAFFVRGTKKICLGVDAASQTGATRLYERAGMSVGSEYVSYEKELRAGRNKDNGR